MFGSGYIEHGTVSISFDDGSCGRKDGNKQIMEEFVPIAWPVFVAICFTWLAIAFFFLAGRKVFFEPYVDESKDEDAGEKTEATAETKA